MSNLTSETTTTVGWLSSNLINVVVNYLPFFVIPLIFYFVVFKPQEKKRQEQENFIKSVKRGEEVVTHSGLYGTVVNIDKQHNTVDLAVSKGVVVKMQMAAIANILRNEGGGQS